MALEIIAYTDGGFAPSHPAEDAFKVGKEYPIFTIADGVTLVERDKDGLYPNPSGAKEVADAFCQKSVEYVEKNFQNFSTETIKEVFEYANQTIKDINDKADRTSETINFFDFDFFHATAALAAIKNDKLFYGRIHDCWIMVIDKNGESKLSLTEPWEWEAGTKALARRPENWKSFCEKERVAYSHKYERNGILKNGELAGYGALTGEDAVLKYLDSGSVNLEKGDIVLVYTDGFEEHDKLKEFLEIFTNWQKSGKEKTELTLKEFSQKKAEEDDKFGHERTLIAVRY